MLQLKRLWNRTIQQKSAMHNDGLCVFNSGACLPFQAKFDFGYSIFLWLFLWLILSVTQTAFAAVTVRSDDTDSKQIEYLTQEISKLTIALNQIQQNVLPKSKAKLNERAQQNHMMQSLLRAKIASLEGLLGNQKLKQQKMLRRLKRLQQTFSTSSGGIVTQEQISKVNNLLEVNKKLIELIQDNIQLAKRYGQALLKESHAIQLAQERRQLNLQISKMNQDIANMNQQRLELYQKNLQIQQQKSLDDSFDATIAYETQVVLNNQFALLLQNRISEIDLQKKLIKTNYLLMKRRDSKTLQMAIHTYQEVHERLKDLINALNEMSALISTEQQAIVGHALQSQFLELQSSITQQLDILSQQQKVLSEQIKETQIQLKKMVATRQTMTTYHYTSWPEIVDEIISMPGEFYQYIKALILKTRDNFIWLDIFPKIIFWSSIMLIVAAFFVLRKLLQLLSHNKERLRMSARLYDGLIALVYRNLPYITLIVLVLAMFWFNGVPYTNYRLLLSLSMVWLAFRCLILIARLNLLERVSDASGRDVRLYYRIKWLLLAGGWSTAFMIFSHQLPLEPILQDIFNRIFMLFLLAVALVIWKSKDIIPYLMRPFLKTKKRYVRHAIRILIILIPLTLTTTAVIGLVGYINLAWALSRYQVDLLLVITGYVLLRGVVFDGLEIFSEWMITSLHNGWLWIEVLLKPLDKLVRVGLLLFGVFVLFQLYGWHSDSWMMHHLRAWVRYPVVNISGIHITILSTVEFIILLCVFIWAAKWTREFCYRWLYRQTRDAGIRNSLSVFTQYAVVLIGAFITLRVLGLDFSGMSMVLGGLAVGMGFGLRDFASNIVGGIMLLIERPVREGDLITLGEYEGRVAHIGIRSMRVSSWDNMEVLIPNAETFNKPFTNWTHQDCIVRTVIPIKVSRGDDPLIVQQLLLDVLAIIPEILGDPPSQVFLKNIDEALVEFEVRYYINVEQYTRFEIRSKVLFAITAQFKAAGVKPPIPPLSVELKESEYEFSDPPPALEERK